MVTKPGTYQVAVQVFNAYGYTLVQKAGYIMVTPSSPPIATAGANQTVRFWPVMNSIVIHQPTSARSLIAKLKLYPILFMTKKFLIWLMPIYKTAIQFTVARFDKHFLRGDVPISDTISHKNYLDYLTKIGNHPGMKILEIGSREVTGLSDARKRFSKAHYVGFDYYPGPNVDVVGDAHKLSSYFDEKFDIIYSSKVFEHFAMPWIVSIEIAKLLNVGGIVFVDTHFSYSSHERPWHFFQFSDMALKVLFSPALGFECIEAGMSNPMVGRYSRFADDNLKYKPIGGLYGHSEFLGRKVRDMREFDWENVDLQDVVGTTKYPGH